MPRGMAAILRPLDLVVWTVCDWALPWANCVREDTQCSVIFLMYKEVNVLCHIWKP